MEKKRAPAIWIVIALVISLTLFLIALGIFLIPNHTQYADVAFIFSALVLVVTISTFIERIVYERRNHGNRTKVDAVEVKKPMMDINCAYLPKQSIIKPDIPLLAYRGTPIVPAKTSTTEKETGSRCSELEPISKNLTGKRALVFFVCVLLIVAVALGISLGNVSRSYSDLQSDYLASKQTINQLEIARKRLDNEVQKLTSYNESLVNENINLGKTNDTLRSRIESMRNSSEPSQEYYSQDDPAVVYITDTGTKYHRDGCQYLRRSKIPIYIQEAIDKGYTACSKCW